MISMGMIPTAQAADETGVSGPVTTTGPISELQDGDERRIASPKEPGLLRLISYEYPDAFAVISKCEVRSCMANPLFTDISSR